MPHITSLCNPYPLRGCTCHFTSLVKTPYHYSRMPMGVNTLISPPWIVRQRDLAENFPGLLRELRISGNRLFNPVARYAGAFNGLYDFIVDDLAWGILMNSVTRRAVDRQCRFSWGFGGPEYDNRIRALFRAANLCLGAQNMNGFFQIVQFVLDILSRISEISGVTGGNGFGTGLALDILDLALQFIPTISDHAPWETYQALFIFDSILARDDDALWRMLSGLSATGKAIIDQFARNDFQQSGSFFSQRVIFILMMI